MSCTFFYKGKLKKRVKPEDLYNEIIAKLDKFKCKYKLEGTDNLIVYINDKSEPLNLKFENNCIDGFCKIELKDYNDMLEIVYSIKNMFYIFEFDDDYGLWNDFLAKKNSCKIKLRELTEEEINEVKQFDYKSLPSRSILLGIIGQDIKKNENDKVSYQYLVDNINPSIPSYTGWDGMELYEIIETWIYDTMSYKDFGKVNAIDKNTKGLTTNMQSFSFGICETLFQQFGGSIGEKQSQIRKLFEQEIYIKNIDIGKDCFLMFRFVLSVLDYLGFKRISKK